MTPSKRLKPFMAYIDPSQHARMKKFSGKLRIPMSQLMREAIEMRITSGNQYLHGFNAGLDKAQEVIKANKASEMRFPSGKSFAELINADIETEKMVEETDGQPKSLQEL